MAVIKSEFPPEPKVIAATTTTAIIGFLLNAITNGISNSDTGVLLTAVPDVLEPFITAIILAVPTFYAGWQAKHQHRRPAPTVTTGTTTG